MKNIMMYSLVVIGVIFISLFLPYESHDDYSSGGLFGASTLLAEGLKTSGIAFVPAYIPILFIGVCLAIIKINENLATAIISLILSLLNLFYMPFLGFLLVFHLNFFGGPRNYELEFGYFLSLFAGIGFAAVMIIHLIVVVRKRRKKAVNPVIMQEIDLLDDALDF
jgi:hypothetical protein